MSYMPRQKKQDYIDFIATRVPKLPIPTLKRVVSLIIEETTKPAVAAPTAKPAARVRFALEGSD